MVYIHAVALDCALGAKPQEILAYLGKNEAPGLTPDSHWLLSGEPLSFGHMTGILPAIPENLAKHQSRNNRALMAVFNSEPRFRDLLDHADLSRVGIILGTSTSGSEEFADYIHGFRKGNPILTSEAKRRNSVIRLNSFPPGLAPRALRTPCRPPVRAVSAPLFPG